MAFLTYSLIMLLYFVVFVRTDDKTGLFELKYSIKRNQIQQQERAFSGYQQIYTKVLLVLAYKYNLPCK
jgi:nucleoside recognition membrane protein YjiH